MTGTDYILPAVQFIWGTFLAGWFLRRQARAAKIAEQRAEAESYAMVESLVRGWIGTMRESRPEMTVRDVLNECVRRLMYEHEPSIKRGSADNAVANVQLQLELPVGRDAEVMLIGDFKPVKPPDLEPATKKRA